MALPDILTGLLRPAAYPHPCGPIRLVETHISWVLLTGDYAYKIKKPVQLPFVDFGTLERRRFFCDEELRCNRRFAPSLYLGVVPVCTGANGSVGIGGTGTVTEWAVRMRQFAGDQELVRLLEAGELGADQLWRFGAQLAAVHGVLPRRAGAQSEVAERVVAPVTENFTTLIGLAPGREALALLERVRAATAQRAAELAPRFASRLAEGFTRECHGDLHLGNLVLIDGAVTAFDCLEFDANLRWIDTQSDVAFLFMDCLVRGRPDLGYAFLDGYLDATGDYAGAVLLPFYAVYRAMVRAKVAGIQARQARANPPVEGDLREATDAGAPFLARMLANLQWADAWLNRAPGRLLLMSGVSGSGKSYLAERLARVLPAVRIRSDVARRPVEAPMAVPIAGHSGAARMAGASAADPGIAAGGVVDAGRYAPERIQAVYEQMAELVPDIVAQGDAVLLDATFITRRARDLLLERARGAGWAVLILHCSAPVEVLRQRVRKRLAEGRDASEADLAVLERQLARQEPFGPEEPVLEIDMSIDLDARRLQQILTALDAAFRPDPR